MKSKPHFVEWLYWEDWMVQHFGPLVRLPGALADIALFDESQSHCVLPCVECGLVDAFTLIRPVGLYL